MVTVEVSFVMRCCENKNEKVDIETSATADEAPFSKRLLNEHPL